MTSRRDWAARWPAWVYSVGEEPDYRFTFANERTFLAWMRTALALLAAGVAVDTLDLSITAMVQRLVAAMLVVLGMLCSAVGWWRWAQAERAMRRGDPLPGSVLSVVLATMLVLVAVMILVLVR